METTTLEPNQISLPSEGKMWCHSKEADAICNKIKDMFDFTEKQSWKIRVRMTDQFVSISDRTTGGRIYKRFKRGQIINITPELISEVKTSAQHQVDINNKKESEENAKNARIEVGKAALQKYGLNEKSFDVKFTEIVTVSKWHNKVDCKIVITKDGVQLPTFKLSNYTDHKIEDLEMITETVKQGCENILSYAKSVQAALPKDYFTI